MDDIFRYLLYGVLFAVGYHFLSKSEDKSSTGSSTAGQKQGAAVPEAGLRGRYIDDGDGLLLTLSGWKPSAARREIIVHALSPMGELLVASHKLFASERGHFYVGGAIVGDSCVVYIPHGAARGCSTPKMPVSVTIVEMADGKGEWVVTSKDRLVLDVPDKSFSLIGLLRPLLTILKGFAEIDGPLSREEVRFIKECVVSGLEPSPQELEELRLFLKEPLKLSIREAVERLSKRPGTSDMKETASVLRLLAMVDGQMNSREERLLRDILGWLGMSRDDIDAFMASGESANGKGGSEVEEAMSVLGLSGRPSKDELQVARRRAMKDFHPDRYQSSDLPDAVKAVIAKQAAAVNAAYDVLIKAFGYARD